MRVRGERDAFGAPGIDPKWTRGNKFGVGTSYSSDSRLWFTIWRGLVTEVYFPLVDHPQLRDLQYLVTDHKSFVVEERAQVEETVRRLSDHSLGYSITNTDLAGRFVLHKEVISDPHLPVLLVHTKFTAAPAAGELGLYAFLEPHLDVGGADNNAYVIEAAGRELLAAEHNGIWVACAASVPFERLTVGYVGRSDALTLLKSNFLLEQEFDRALGGNVALAAQVADPCRSEFTLAVAFGRGLAPAVSALLQSLAEPFQSHKDRFSRQWERVGKSMRGLAAASHDKGNLATASYSLLLGHEDKTFPGAFPASLSIPWGNAKGDGDRGGYHLIWTRDLVHTATGLLAAGDKATPLRVLIYLATSQEPDGGFPQNFWVNGEPYWHGVQLDEVAFPILLARKLDRARALREFDPYPMVRAATRYLLEHGPVTGQERWEELSGYSPSTLAAVISATVASAAFARERGETSTAQYLLEHADYLESRLEAWTTTSNGSLVPEVRRHFVRIRPADPIDPARDVNPTMGTIRIANRAADLASEFPAESVVDAGFLELVRYGVRRADDPLVVDSLAVVDSVLKVETTRGPVWRRYNHDGYGQTADGGPFTGAGTGRPWPLLTGERGHYELAAGRDPTPFIRALERFASPTGMLPEQVWDEDDQPALHLYRGGPTGSAMPLLWAHSEYLTLLRSVRDGKPFDRISEVVARYGRRKSRPTRELWQFGRQPSRARAGSGLRIQAAAPFTLHWSTDDWRTTTDTDAVATEVGLQFVDLEVPERAGEHVSFTFYWPTTDRWEGQNFSVEADGSTLE